MRDYSNALAQPASLKTRVANMRLRRRLSQMDGSGSKQDVERALRGDWFKGYMARYPDFYFLDGQPYADRYLRYESLQADYDETRQSLGLPPDALPKTKTKVRPKARDYRDYYTELGPRIHSRAIPLRYRRFRLPILILARALPALDAHSVHAYALQIPCPRTSALAREHAIRAQKV